MFPNRNPNPLPPIGPQIHPKEVVNELCDRIKNEYSGMYNHVQSLKNELDKTASQRQHYERIYTMNQDMSYFFTTEIHKMMDIIKRLLNACQQQIPFLPYDLQGNYFTLIEQVKNYTASDVALPFLHQLSVNNPHIHEPYLPPHPAYIYPRPPPDHREVEPYRYPIKDLSAPNTDSGASLYKDKQNRQNGSNEVSVTPPSAKTLPENQQQSPSPKFNESDKEKDTENSGSKAESQEKDENVGVKRGAEKKSVTPKKHSPSPIQKRPEKSNTYINSIIPKNINGSYPLQFPSNFPENPHLPQTKFIRPYDNRHYYPPPPHHFQPDFDQHVSKGCVPSSLNAFSPLSHGDVVCAASFSRPLNYVFTGSKGVVKIWDVSDISKPKHLSSVDCLKDNYVRACKSINSNKTLIVCGEYSSLGIWSLNMTPSGLAVSTVSELNNPAPVCYNMAITPDERQVYCCCNNGTIVAWDIETTKVIRNFTGHVDGATSIDIPPDGSCIWTGGLDSTARCWDMRDSKQLHSFSFPTQVFSLCSSPCGSYIVVGLENKTIELCYYKDSGNRFGERNVFKVHDSCVLTVKIANNGRWLISSSKDNYTNCVQIPLGKPLFITRDTASILCADISPDDKYIITGAGDKKATIYECIY